MRPRHRYLLPVFLLAAAIPFTAGFAVEESPGSPINLGDFYYECARAFGIELPEGWERSKSWLLLRAAGLEVDGEADFSQPLRQKHVIQIASQLGIKISSSRPDDPFTRKQVEAFLTRFQAHFRLPLQKPAPESSGGGPEPADSPEPGSS